MKVTVIRESRAVDVARNQGGLVQAEVREEEDAPVQAAWGE